MTSDIRMEMLPSSQCRQDDLMNLKSTCNPRKAVDSMPSCGFSHAEMYVINDKSDEERRLCARQPLMEFNLLSAYPRTLGRSQLKGIARCLQLRAFAGWEAWCATRRLNCWDSIDSLKVGNREKRKGAGWGLIGAKVLNNLASRNRIWSCSM